MKKVDVMIGGMQKGGTTALAKYLENHPGILSHPQLEMTFFVRDEEYEKGWEKAWKHYFAGNTSSQKGLVLAKHATHIGSEQAMERLLKHSPEVKLLIVLRNPVARAWSSCLMEVGYGQELSSFDAVVDQVYTSKAVNKKDWRERFYIGLGIYADFIEKVYTLHKKENVKIVLLEELVAKPDKVLTDVFSWLGLDGQGYNFQVTDKKHNAYSAPRSTVLTKLNAVLLNNNNKAKSLLKSVLPVRVQLLIGQKLRKLNQRDAVPPKMSNETKAKLTKFYTPHNQRLEEVLKRDLSIWNN